MPITINGSTGIAGVDGSASTPAIQGTDTNTGVTFPAADTVAVSTGGSERMRINSSGNVGIGTNNPTNTLAVNGGIATIANDQAIIIGGTLSSDFGIRQQAGISSLVFNWKPNVFISMGSDNRWVFNGGGGIAVTGGASYTSDFTYYAKGNPNNTGYAASNTVSDVSIYGSARVWGREFNAHSDVRLKDVTGTLSVEEAKYFVQTISPKKYRWKSEGKQGAVHIGLIAQDVAAAGFFGMLTSYDDHTLVAEEYDGVMQPEGKRLMLDYNQIAPLLMTLVKDLYKELETVKSELDAANARIGALEAK